MKKTVMLALSCLIAVSLLFVGCDLLLEEPFGETEEGTTLSHDDMPIGDMDTGIETYIFPDIPADGTIPAETSPRETSPRETSPVEPDIRMETGTVVEYPGEEPMDHVFAIEAWRNGEWTTLYVYYDDPSMDACVGDEVIFTYDANAEVMDSYDGVPVLVALSMEFAPLEVPEKPVIYLYPETPTEVSVKLTIDGKLTCTYPAYGKGWDNFTAHPDGTLVFPDGKQYYCLYWEGIQNMDCDFSKGFCVKGEDTAAFLEYALERLGLTRREANEFIVFWLSMMQNNPYNVIAFQENAYTESARLDVDPAPDTLIRVFMAWQASEIFVNLPEQELSAPAREGFTVVEWGGTEIS